MKHKRSWKNLLINPQYQMKYAFWITFTGLFLVVTNGAVFYLFVRENYKTLVDLSPMEEAVKEQLYRELNQIILGLGGFALFFMVLTSFFAIILSHRTAGPMYHFKRVFMEIQKGKTSSRVRLRPKDDFRDVAEECNKMIDYLTSSR